MRMKRILATTSARRRRNAAGLCVAIGLLEIASAEVAHGRAARPKVSPCGDFCPAPTYPNQTSVHDGQPYGLRSGGQGPLNASGSYGAMLEGRNPVGSTGF